MAPAGGLCQGAYLKEALRRYEQLWLPLLASQRRAGGAWQQLVPPLDVAFIWHLHRLHPSAYETDCAAVLELPGANLHVTPEQAFQFTDGSSDAQGSATAQAWSDLYPAEPFYPPIASSRTTAFKSQLSVDLAAVAVRQPIFTHQLLRASYLQKGFLNRAVERYAKFLLLRKHRLDLSHAIPALDIVLMWHTHMSGSAAYHKDCLEILGRYFEEREDSATLDRTATGPWRFHFNETKKVWEEEFHEPYLVPDSGYISMDHAHPSETAMSQFLGFYEDNNSMTNGSWRAGAHALYLTWLGGKSARVQRQREGENQSQSGDRGGLFSCCFGGGGGRQTSSAATQAGWEGVLRDKAAGFVEFRNLPHSSSHPYWQQFTLRGPDVLPAVAEPGAELERYSATTSSIGMGNGTAKVPYKAVAQTSDVYSSGIDQGALDNNGSFVAPSAPLFWGPK
eukprot:jgi/Chrzof1/11355/Cz05g33160.t1